MRPRQILIGRIAVVVAALLLVIAWFAAYSGGAGTTIAGLRISAHNPARPLLYALACLAVALLLPLWTGGTGALARELRWWGSIFGRVASAGTAFRGGRISALAAITALAIAIDCAQWWRGAPLWLDEQMIAINFRDRSFAELTGSLWLGQSAPLGWLWLERCVLLLLGPGERGLRLVPVAFGVATSVAAAWMARRWLGTTLGLLLVSLCAVGSSLSHYRFELKHYSADVFWALLLPALTVWATENVPPERRRMRALMWAAVAGGALWTSYGALLVAPGCLVWMFVQQLRIRDRSAVVRFLIAAGVWLLLFAGHYALSTQYTHNNEFLRVYWDNRFPPQSAGPLDRLAWIGEQLSSVGRDAGGTRLSILLFVVGIGGLLLAPNRGLGVVYVGVPVTAVVLAALRLVPVFERFSLWVIPSLYVGIVFAVHRGFLCLKEGVGQRRPLSAAAGVLICALAMPLVWDILKLGWTNLDFGGPLMTNHGMDDKRGVAWLMQQRQAGDAIVTTRLGWPAIWWYGGISLKDNSDGVLPDGSRMYQLSFGADRQRCARLPQLLQPHRRLLLYVSFPDESKDVIARLDHEVMPLGSVIARGDATSETRASVLRLDPVQAISDGGLAPGTAPNLEGCLELVPAVRW